MECSKLVRGIVHVNAIVWDSDTLWHIMNCYVMLHNMIVADEHDGSAHTNDFEKPNNHVLLSKQDAKHVVNFIEMH